ncbi:MAG: hypothetical protein ETSY1_41895, partial [Candidatus Entotheonella factor]
VTEAQPVGVFNRIATFYIFENTDIDRETVAKIVAVSEDGNLLVYTDSETENVGFVDISDSANPQADGRRRMGGEPTSVAVTGQYALVGVNTSESFVDPRGRLKVIDLNTNNRRIVADLPLGGQPDSVAVSPDGAYAAVVIENERDEDLGDGAPPQLPAGFLVIVDLDGEPRDWTTRNVELTGIADLFPEDPEPEFVAINRDNIAAVTLQENNHIVLVNLADGSIVNDWNAGTADLMNIDVVENELIELDGMLTEVPREADAIVWVASDRLATADEGDLDGGSRSFTIYDPEGEDRFSSGNTLEHRVVRLGHYPEERSEDKGNEPEGITTGIYGDTQYLFVGSERSSVVFVYHIDPDAGRLDYVQALPTGVGPEGLLAIPERNLFVVASEVDSREDKIRSSITLYELGEGPATYPTIASANRADGLPIPWGALSALAADRDAPQTAYTAYDSFYRESRLFTVDLSASPPMITGEILLRDVNGSTFDLDIEGLSTRADGGFWVVSEGAGSVDDPDRPVTSMNLLMLLAADGTVLRQVELPEAVNELQRRFGFEGVASVGSGDDERVYVAFQREWVDDPDNQVRIGCYDPSSEEWTFFYYPIDEPESANGGWVGLSEIVAVDDTTFLVVERDNQGGPDAAIKKIYSFSIDGLNPRPQGRRFPVADKTLVRDILPDLQSDNGPVLEKVEGLMITADGVAWIVTDNDGVDDSSGETQFLSLGNISE